MQLQNVIFIRHAQSLINKATKEIVQKYKIPNTYQYLKNYPQWVNNVKYSMDFLDCPITQLGQSQCLKARKKAGELNPDVILVSPMERALQTCNILFGNRNIPIIVQPILTESVRSSCDLCSEIKPKKLRYPHFNFQNVLKEGQQWNFRSDEQNSEKYLKVINECGALTLYDKNEAVLKYMSQNLSYEKPKSMRNRVKKVKQLLKNYKQKYNMIVVVAHFNTINYTVTKQFSEQNEPKNSIKIHNCQFHSQSIQQLLKYS